MSDFMVFMTLAKSNQLDPFRKQIWAFKNSKGDLVSFAGRDGFLELAQRNPNYQGIQSAAIYENDEYEIDPFPADGGHGIHHRVTKLKKAERGALLGAAAVAYLRDMKPYVSVVMLEDYHRGNSVWNKNTEAMIMKVAETNSLKKIAGSTGLQSEYDWDVKGEVVVAHDKSGQTEQAVQDAVFADVTDEDEQSQDEQPKANEKMDLFNALMEFFDAYPDNEDVQGIREICKEKQAAKELTIDMMRNFLAELMAMKKNGELENIEEQPNTEENE
jgi:hypothetical protein